MARKLDRSRKFSTSYGETNMRYYQDGVYFDASGDEVVTTPPETRSAPPLAAGKPAGKVAAGATSTAVDSSGRLLPAVSEAELRAQLAPLNFAQTKSMFVKAGGPPDIKGPGALARMVDWLVANRDKTVAADAAG